MADLRTELLEEAAAGLDRAKREINTPATDQLIDVIEALLRIAEMDSCRLGNEPSNGMASTAKRGADG